MRFPGILVGAAALIALSCAACGAGATAGGGYGAAAATTTTSPMMTTSAAMAGDGSGSEMMQFGAACDQVPASGAGSFDGMAKAPVATAASNNPLLSTLVSAVQKADLANTLNNAGQITVFAPDNTAFGKLPKATLSSVLANTSQLTKILTYHVVSGRITPAQLAVGKFKTLEGGTITTTGTGQDYTINGSAHVVCGNVQTANATVYIIDSVLMPSM